MAGGGGIGGIVNTVVNPISALFGGGQNSGGGASSNTAGIMPTRPEFNSLVDPATGLMKSQYINPYGSDITPDKTALNALQANSLSTAPSSWANAQNAQADLQNQGLKNSTQNQNASANAQAQSSLASKFGLSPAAQARLASQNMKAGQAGLQNVGFQGAQAKAAIGAQDATNKQNQLMAIPGMQNADAASQLANRQASLTQQNLNTGNAINQVTLKNAADLNTYNQQMAVYGANKNSDAMRNQGSSGKK